MIQRELLIKHFQLEEAHKCDTLPYYYDLYACTCADGSVQQVYVDFTNSYSPIASIGSIQVLLNIAASSRLFVSSLDISNAIIFDATERVYISLPPFYFFPFIMSFV
jgi:hypothetical protein